MKAIIVLIAFLFFLHFSPHAFAARSISISADKASLFGEEELTTTASSSGFTNGETIYIKGAFYQEGSSNYFGYTKNVDNWIKNGDSTLNQKSIQIGQWDGSLTVKSDFVDSGYNGEGGYKFKIGFYYITSGGNPSSVNWSSNSLDININEPDPTLTPTPTETPTPTLTPTATPTSTPAPTKTPTPIPNTPTPKPSSTPTPETLPTDVLGENTESEATDGNVLIANKVKKSDKTFQKLFIILGIIVFLSACGIVGFPIIKKKFTKDE